MNTFEKISPDDPRLTAYALGEMEAAERAEFELRLQQDAEARAAVDAIRATVVSLGEALAAEAVPQAGAAPGEGTATVPSQPDAYARGGSRLLRFPSLYFVTAGLAAAGFAIVFVMNEGESAARADRGMVAAKRRVAAQEAQREESPAMAAPPPVTAMRAAAPPPAAALANSIPLMAEEASVPDQFVATAETALSTFPLRVERESFDELRAALRERRRPARESVQVAAMVNAFQYAWPATEAGAAFATLFEETSAPWAPEHRLVRVGLRGAGEGVVARDARVAVSFNPERVRAWRLIGFERADALGVRSQRGDTLRAGDAVTALYEIVPAEVAAAVQGRTLLTLTLAYRDGATGAGRLLERTLEARTGSFAGASPDMKFAVGVAAFGLKLRDSPLQPAVPLQEIVQWVAEGAAMSEERQEFTELMRSTEEWLH